MTTTTDNELGRENLEDLYPLSPMQEGMLFHALLNPESEAYFVQQGYRVRGKLDIALVEESWNRLIARHQVLRTVFVAEKARRPLQMVLRKRRVACRYSDLRGMESAEQQQRIDRTRREERRESFQLERDVLVRLHILQLDDDRSYVLWNVHHILLDGWCMSILQREFVEVYQSLSAGREPRLPPTVPYSRYIEWLEKQDRPTSLEYWRGILDGYESLSTLPGRQRPAEKQAGYDLRIVSRCLEPATWKQLEEQAVAWRVTPGTILQVVWAVLLGRWNRSDDVVFGTVVSGRPVELDEVEGMLGLFMNTVPVRVRTRRQDSLRTLAVDRQEEMLASEPHQFVPLSEVQTASPLGSGLLDHIVAFENYPVSPDSGDEASGQARLSVESTDRFEQTGYDFVLVILPGDVTQVEFQFNALAFDEAQIQRLADQFVHLLGQALDEPERPVSQFALQTPDDRRLVAGFNDTARPWAPDTSFVKQFEQRAIERPDSPAIVDQDGTTTYRQLDSIADALARHLRTDCGAGRESRVGVVIGRSRWLAAAMLGAMKSGAAYVPVDPEQPPERLRLMLEDSACSAVVVAGEPGWNDSPFTTSVGATVPVVDIRRVEVCGSRPAFVARPNDVAYMIYTSGSTGPPKAAMIEHQSAAHFVAWNRRYHGLDTESRCTLFSSPGFDASVWEMLPCLASGGCLYEVPPAARVEPSVLAAFLNKHDITHSFVPTALCEQMLRDHAAGLPENLRLLTGGEALRAATTTDGTELFNHYGPTECTVLVTATEVRPDHGESPPIGRPIDNTTIRILDHADQPAGIGCAGEICVGGLTVGRGYWRQAALTAEAFTPDPDGHGDRLYRTGDLGRWRADGSIEFLGRRDQQFKLRGHRIELGEIEYALAALDSVAAAAVAVSRSRLIAFVVPGDRRSDHAQLFDPQQIRDALTARLPAYMIPSRFVELDAIPLTERDKIDRRQLHELAEHELDGQTQSEHRRPLETDTQRMVAAVWADVLECGAAGIGPDDDFYAIGGHSLAATRIVAQVRQRTEIKVPLRAVFEATTVAEFAARIDQLKASAESAGPENATTPPRRGPVALPRTARAQPDP